METKFAAGVDGLELDELMQRVLASATDGVTHDKPFPFTAEELTPEFLKRVLDAAKSIWEPIVLDPTPERRLATLVSALGPVITGEGAMARLTFHAGYHQGQAYQMKHSPDFPA